MLILENLKGLEGVAGFLIEHHQEKMITIQKYLLFKEREPEEREERNTVRKSKAGKEKGGAHKRTAPFQKQLLFMGQR